MLSVYLAAVAGAGALVLVAALGRLDLGRVDPVAALLLLTLAVVAQRMPVRLFRSSAISVAYVATIAAYVLYGMPFGVLVNLASAVVNAFTPRVKPIEKIAFNTASLTLAAACAGVTYELLGEVSPTEILPTIAAVAASAVVYFASSTALTTLVIALSTGAKAMGVWRENYAGMTLNYAATAIVGAMLALAYRSLGLAGAVSFVVPLGVAWYSFRLYATSASALRERNRELVRLSEKLRSASSRPDGTSVAGVRALIDRYREGPGA